MAKQFDTKQQIILDSVAQHQLVSAGAGSGKTTVMIQKICDLILSNTIKPSEIVVLTFTNLAGAEMKQRLLSSLNEALKNAKTEKDIQGQHLKEGRSQSCGCLRKELMSQKSKINMIGQRFGHLTVIA